MPTRKNPGTLSVGERRVREIVELMVASQWSPTAASHLAQKWRCSEANVRKFAAEASRRIKAHVGENSEVVRERILANLDRIVGACSAPSHFGAAVKALQLQCQIHGLLAEPEQTVNHRFAEMTTEEVERRYRETVAKIKASGG